MDFAYSNNTPIGTPNTTTSTPTPQTTAGFRPTFGQVYAYFAHRLPKERLPKHNSTNVHCPFHTDRKPSLSLNLAKGMWYCHSCGRSGGMLDFERELMGSDAEVAWSEIYRITRTEPPKYDRKLTATYDYTDASGKLLYQKLRYTPKDFSQRQPDGKSGWRYKLDCAKKVLYRLPQVVTARVLAVVEGEKDADNLQAALDKAMIKDFATTTNFDGASNWRNEYAPYFASKMAVVIPDNDARGKTHAQIVCASIKPYAERIKLVELPGLREKEDVSDWLAAGNTVKRLLELIHAAPLWSAPEQIPTTEGGFNLVAIGELLARPEMPPDYLVDDLLVRGTVSVIVAKPKVGKSVFARNLCLAVARGREYLGHTTRQGSCIYLALEERAEEITSDFRVMGATNDDPISVHAAPAPAEAILALTDLVRVQHPALVVVDPLFRFTSIRDEKAYSEVYGALGPLIDLARETGTHILLVHHSGKSPKTDAVDSPLLGSTAIAGAVSTVIVERKRENYRTIETVTRIGQPTPETVLAFDPDTRLLSIGSTREETDCKLMEEQITTYLKTSGEKTESEINEVVEGRNAAKRQALRALVAKGAISRSGTDKRNDPYRYLYPCPQYGAGTRVQETKNGSQTRINVDEKLVLGNSENAFFVSEILEVSTEPEKASGDAKPGDAAEPEVWL